MTTDGPLRFDATRRLQLGRGRNAPPPRAAVALLLRVALLLTVDEDGSELALGGDARAVGVVGVAARVGTVEPRGAASAPRRVLLVVKRRDP